jgi:DNA-binding XRE family transcriptional regulator
MAKRRKVQIVHDEIVRLFAGRLRSIRLSRGMTQTELADKAGVTATYISKLESVGAGDRPGGAPGDHDDRSLARHSSRPHCGQSVRSGLRAWVMLGSGRETFLTMPLPPWFVADNSTPEGLQCPVRFAGLEKKRNRVK